MAKAIRLVNVDECVTSDGKVVKWADYWVHPQGADGHGSSADSVMFGGGWAAIGRSYTCDMKKFSSTATATGHGYLNVANARLAAASDGAQVMFGGGYIVTHIQTETSACSMKQFSSTSESSGHGSLTQARSGLAAASDGTQVMFAGGDAGSISNTCDMKQFASTATAVDHGDLIQPKRRLAAGSDGTQVMFGGGDDNLSRNTCELKQFSNNSAAVAHGNLTKGNVELAAGSDGTQVMFGGGYADTGSQIDTCELKQFSSTSIAVAHGNLTQGRYTLAAGSDGTQVMFVGGMRSGNPVNTCDIKQFASTAIAVDHGDLSESRQSLAGASGIAA